jgi:DNA-binding transcriptional MerR regulator
VPDRSHLSIGEVLSLLRDEFPDVTISKIRFLESQGLVDPERTPSGYRKFYEHDVDRLRWILRQQRENFLPLKVIKGRLTDQDDDESGGLEGSEMDGNGSGAPDAVPVRPSGAGAGDSDAEYPDPPAAPGVDSPGGRYGQASLPDAREGSEWVASGAPPRGAGPVSLPSPAVGDSNAAPGMAEDTDDLSGRQPAGSWPAAPSGSGASGPPAGGTGSGVPSGAGVAPGADVAPGAGVAPGPDVAFGGGVPSGVGVPPGAGDGPPGGGPPGGGQAGVGGGAAGGGQAGAGGGPPGGGQAGAGGGRPGVPGTWPGAGSAAGAQRLLPADEEADSFTLEELMSRSGLDQSQVEELTRFGLISPASSSGGERYYDADSVAIAAVSAGFARHGVEARHLRGWRNSAEREVSLFEQVVVPLLRQRNPQARHQAGVTLDELAELGASLREILVRRALRQVH